MQFAQTQLQAANGPVEVEVNGGGFEDSIHLVVVSAVPQFEIQYSNG
jgi:hypothetical protein